ncbi:putative disease resistance protein RGA3 [Phoenix dactylifera]|uniref:Disease resistance protein RGA3 n=1 Tax=Phoenix dactylifera TaxID=42345 RepID=A0A8B9AXP4_PHODC|nr:putative disease resistance protein RGA3 [Phoenix dactylifera]
MNSVAEMIGKVMEGTEEPVKLRGIEWNAYLLLFRRHAFAGVNPDDHGKLQRIGDQIAKKLWGSPLGANVVGGMLNSNLKFEFWKEVLENGVFNSIQNGDFQPVLRFRYIQFSPQLQHCFRYCSIFLQDYLFERDELVRMWMAAGLIQQSEDKKRSPEDIGCESFDSLLWKSFFDWALYWVGTNTTYYVIHDLLHKMVCSVSKDECLGVDYSKPNPRDNPTTLRHLSIMVDDPLVLSKVPRLKNLHTLVLWIHGHDRRWDVMVNKVLKGFKNLRVLKLESSATCKHRSLNEIDDLKHLRYLHLDKIVDTTSLTKSVYKLYHLQTMIVLCLDPSTKRIGEGMKSLINLRHLILPSELDKFHVREGNGCKIGELKHLKELRGELHIKNLKNVRSCEDAREAELHNKEHLRILVLQWDTNSSSTSEVAANVIDGLGPHFCLANLKIIGYSGACPPCWLETRYLAMLESITLSNCEELELLPPLEELPFLKFLSLENMRALRQVGHAFLRHNMVTSFGRLEVLKFRMVDGFLASSSSRSSTALG